MILCPFSGFCPEHLKGATSDASSLSDRVAPLPDIPARHSTAGRVPPFQAGATGKVYEKLGWMGGLSSSKSERTSLYIPVGVSLRLFTVVR